MKIITQQSIFDYTKIEILGDLERCKLLIENVPDEEIVKELKKMRGKGRNEYPVDSVWNALLVMPLLECSTVEQLRRELSRNSDLRRICGFDDMDYYFGKCKLVPPAKAFTNMMNNLKKIEHKLKECFYELRNFMSENLKDFGKDTGEDGKIFNSKAKGYNKNGDAEDGRCDMDADFAIKEIYYKDPTDGTTKIKKKKYFGYRYHLLADVNYELPIEYTVTKASKGEREQLKKHLKMLPEEIRNKIETLSADKGYDSEDIIQTIKSYGIKPIIDIRNQWKDKEKTKQYKNTNIVYTYDGKVFYTEDNGELTPMRYLGYDKAKNKLRYEHKGKVYGIELSTDYRIFTPIARDSKKWERIYNKRTSLERINGRFDRDFNLENNRVRGLKKAQVMIDIMMIGMLSMAKGHILNNEEDKIRKLKSV